MSIEYWIILAIGFFIIEMVTYGFFVMWFGVGSLVAALLNYLGFDVKVQIFGFLLVSLVLILSSRKFAKKVTKEHSKKATSERLVGKVAIVMKKLDNEKGIIKINGEEWLANLDNTIEINDSVKITGIEGTKLVVEKIKED